MDKNLIKHCKIHGNTKFLQYKAGKYQKYRCKECVNQRTNKKRNDLKIKSLEYKGNKCSLCGYDKCIISLTFHHLDPNEKDFGISRKGYTKPWEEVKKELDKCILLCSNCHAEEHEKLETFKIHSNSIKAENVKNWRNRTKIRMILSMGNKCQICFYEKCSRALTFHHLNPKEKDFSFGKLRSNIKGWKYICEELKKCVLLCANCHFELHEEIISLPETFSKFNSDYENYRFYKP